MTGQSLVEANDATVSHLLGEEETLPSVMSGDLPEDWSLDVNQMVSMRSFAYEHYALNILQLVNQPSSLIHFLLPDFGAFHYFLKSQH